MITKPPELEEAEIVEALAQRYHVLPSAVRAEDAAILRHIELIEMAHPKGGD